LVQRAQTVSAFSGGARVGRARLTGDATTLVVPLRPRNGTCSIEFTTTPTAVPHHGDLRRLGVHFRALRYTPAA
jgi:hypothetical protein